LGAVECVAEAGARERVAGIEPRTDRIDQEPVERVREAARPRPRRAPGSGRGPTMLLLVIASPGEEARRERDIPTPRGGEASRAPGRHPRGVSHATPTGDLASRLAHQRAPGIGFTVEVPFSQPCSNVRAPDGVFLTAADSALIRLAAFERALHSTAA